MSEARSPEEAARSLRLALYDMQSQPDWGGGATRADIIRYCLSRQLPTPERYFEAAIEEVNPDRATQAGYESTMEAVRYSLTPEGRAEVARERRDHHLYLDEPAAPPIALSTRPNEVFSRPAPSSPVAVQLEREPEQPRTSLPDILARWSALPEPLRLLAVFAAGTITGVVLSHLR